MGKLNWIYMLTNGSHDGAGIAKEFILGAEFAMRGLFGRRGIMVRQKLVGLIENEKYFCM